MHNNKKSKPEGSVLGINKKKSPVKGGQRGRIKNCSSEEHTKEERKRILAQKTEKVQ